MISPLVICDGLIRSGSTWSFNVCRLLMQISSRRSGQPCGIACLRADSLERFLQTEVFTHSGAAVIKVHEIGPIAANWIREGRARAVCTYRDPRDCVASDMPFWGNGFDASVQRVMISLKSVHTAHGDAGKTLLIRYEDMMSDRLQQIRRTANYLNVPVSAAELQWIDAQTNLETSRSICRTLTARQNGQVDIGTDGHRRDRVTLLHDNHIGSAKVGRWKEELSEEQAVALESLFEASLRVMGYAGENSNEIRMTKRCPMTQ